MPFTQPVSSLTYFINISNNLFIATFHLKITCQEQSMHVFKSLHPLAIKATTWKSVQTRTFTPVAPQFSGISTASFCSVPDYPGSTPCTYTPLPCYQPMSKPRQYYFNAAAYWKKVFTVQLPPLGFPPGPLHPNTRPHTCWTVGELCGGRALPPTLPTDSGDLSPSRLRWPCPQNFCTTRSPFHIIPGFTHRGQGSLFFGIRGETYCLNTHFLKPIS